MSIARQSVLYSIFGVVQIGVDWLVFVLLTQIGLPTGSANITSRITAAAMGFWLNGKWTFAKQERTSLGAKHLGKFLVSWGLTTLASTAVVVAAAHFDGMHAAWIVKPIADLVLAAFGFAASKYWIYR